jgi:hypothetical protein
MTINNNSLIKFLLFTLRVKSYEANHRNSTVQIHFGILILCRRWRACIERNGDYVEK